jgi:hypothetical protein
VAERHGGHGWSLSPSGCAGCEPAGGEHASIRCEIGVVGSSRRRLRRRRCQACRCRCALDPGSPLFTVGSLPVPAQPRCNSDDVCLIPHAASASVCTQVAATATVARRMYYDIRVL